MFRLIALLILASSALAQNPRHVIATWPRMLINDEIPDTWDPVHFPGAGNGRLSAIVSRTCGNSACSIAGTSAQAFADFNSLRNVVDLTNPAIPSYGNAADEGLVFSAMDWAYAYQIFHKLGNDAIADQYAQKLYDYINRDDGLQATGGTQPKFITAIDTDSGGNPFITFSAPHGITLGTPGSVSISLGGASLAHDGLMGRTQIWAVPNSTTIVTNNLGGGFANLHITDAGMMATISNAFLLDSNSTGAVKAIAIAYAHDWIRPWLVTNGHLQQIIDVLKMAYWCITPTRTSSAYNENVRESDFHNYGTWPETAVMQIGVTLQGEDPLGQTILDEGVGYAWEGIAIHPDDSHLASVFTYNYKASLDTLSGGAGNMEGPEYWRNGTNRFETSNEAFDTATGRFFDIWHTQFSTVNRAGLYLLYTFGPGGLFPLGIGDTHTFQHPSGRNNMGMAIINDRSPSGHFQWYMDNSGGGWNTGSDSAGLLIKLTFYPYAGGPTSHDLTDLPLSDVFGPDVIIRTGWGTTDTYLWITGSLPATTHRPANAGGWGLYKGALLAIPATYTDTVTPSYPDWQNGSMGHNIITIRDPNMCWTENGVCGQGHFGDTEAREGQRHTKRTLNPPFSFLYSPMRSWGAANYSDPVYAEVEALTMPTFSNSWTGVEYAKFDLSKAYTNNYGSGSNTTAAPTANLSPNTPGAITRELVHFQAVSTDTDKTILFSRVTSADASFVKADMIHTAGPMQSLLSGVWTTPAVGISTATAPTAMRTDNGTARMFVVPLLPAAAKARTVGGHLTVPICNATLANPVVFTTCSPHGMTVGEPVSISVGSTFSNWGGVEASSGDTPGFTVLSAPTSTTFTIGFDSSALTAFTTVFTSGSGAPVGACTNGRMYFNTVGGQPYLCQSGAWSTSGTFGQNGGPQVDYHRDGGWEEWVDQWGAAGAPGINLRNNYGQYPTIYGLQLPGWFASWRVEMQPPSANLTDYFLNVVIPTTTAVSSPPATTLITASGWKGAQIVDTAATYVAMFPLSSSSQTSASYTSTHSGTGRHLVSGLSAGSYAVSQGGTSLGNFTAGADGTVSFSETGGGNFQVGTPGPGLAGGYLQGQASGKGNATIH